MAAGRAGGGRGRVMKKGGTSWWAGRPREGELVRKSKTAQSSYREAGSDIKGGRQSSLHSPVSLGNIILNNCRESNRSDKREKCRREINTINEIKEIVFNESSKF